MTIRQIALLFLQMSLLMALYVGVSVLVQP